MKTVTRTAFSNIRANKSRNILTGIAIFLTTLLLFVIPGVGFGVVNLEFAAVNQVYPTFHGLYRDVSPQTAQNLKASDRLESMGLRCDPAVMVNETYTISMVYLDETCAELNKSELAEGHFPQKENEIVVSEGLLKAMGLEGRIGDTIRVPYQPITNEGLDYSREKDFVICGMTADSQINEDKKLYSAFVSEEFVKQNFPVTDISYRVYFRLPTVPSATTDDMEEEMKDIAAAFEIPEDSLVVNTEYLAANYVDPSTIPMIIMIMLIVVLAGVITIYSIYYVSMIHKVQEYGRLKAIGATKHQIRQIVLREGFFTAAFAIPAGLLAGTATLEGVFPLMYKIINADKKEDMVITAISEIVKNHKVQYLHAWLYFLAAGVALMTVYLSLLKPMKIAARISPIEALRYNGEGRKGKGTRKGYEYLNLFRPTCSNLSRNKKRTVITIVSMAITGVFFVTVSAGLSCAAPRESAASSIDGQYYLSVITESGNKEHPELEWSQVQQNNPLTPEFIRGIESLDGVEKTEVKPCIPLKNKKFEEQLSLVGYSENYAEILEKGIVEGKVTYEELQKGNKVILSKTALHWYPELKVGDKITFQYSDGNVEKEKSLEIAAIGNYSEGIVNYSTFLTAKSAVNAMSQYNVNDALSIFADKDYDAELEKALVAACEKAGGIELADSWQKGYEEYKTSMSFMYLSCYVFLGILGVICMMNMMNTMINSIHVRKKELGMMQAIGLSDKQLVKMLNLEGLFYTMGTLLCSVSLGSFTGYLFFLYAKENHIMGIQYFHYPTQAILGLIIVMILLQVILSTAIGKSLKKESLMERIRFSE